MLDARMYAKHVSWIAVTSLSSRANQLLTKLAGSTWITSANTMRSSALVLCYSAAEYCVPVWSRSAHTSRVDVQLNSTMRLISGTLHSTPLPWLPLLSNVEPPALQRKADTDKLVEKIVKYDSWPIQPDILNPSLLWLTSRKLLWLELQPVNIKSRWSHNWKSAQVVNSHLVCDPIIQQPGFDLPRQQWCLLNRCRTEQGHCGACRRKWRLADTDLCHCGETQMMSHIVESCPMTKLNGGLPWLFCRWRRCFVADQFWFMTRIRQEECIHIANAGNDTSSCVCVCCHYCIFTLWCLFHHHLAGPQYSVCSTLSGPFHVSQAGCNILRTGSVLYTYAL